MQPLLARTFLVREIDDGPWDLPGQSEPGVGFKISFIIAARPGQVPYVALRALRALKLPKERFEILVAYGKKPARQRNQAARQASGDFLYFLDDDSGVSSANLACLESVLQEFAVSPDRLVLGGPVVLPPSSSQFEEAMGIAFASPLGIGPYRFRYSAEGPARYATERDLILANLIVSRSLFLASEGFQEDLYPGEENQWLKRVTATGIKPIYHPNFICHRHQREGLAEVLRLGFHYGRGRAKHFFEHLQPLDLLLLAPSSLVVTLALALVTRSLVAWALLTVYLVTVLAASLVLGRFQRPTLSLLGIFPLLHFGYGLGFMRGWFAPKKKLAVEEVDIELHSLKSLFQRPNFA